MLDPAVRLYGGGRTLVRGTRIIRLAEGGPAALRALLADTRRRPSDASATTSSTPASPTPAPARARSMPRWSYPSATER